ncbi:MAG: hypothetical protein MJE68_17615, partial [Proteobacteria bacterium]|nr:hypothetical protein [Pseudomonadota bacterium]
MSRGGAISLNGDSLIKECIFDKNYAIRGGALSFKGKIVEVVDCLFTKNEAVQNGGAMQVTYSSSNSSFILSNTSFISN